MKLVVVGLSLSSSWGNGHATTYRSLLRAFAERGHEITFFEWDAPWYGGENRDLPDPSFCELILYGSRESATAEIVAAARDADATIVGSYVHEGDRVIDALTGAGVSPLFFYDIDAPVTVEGLRAGGLEYLRPEQVPAFDAYLSFTGGPFLQDVLERELGAQRALPLFCSVDPDRYCRTDPEPAMSVDLAYMGTYAADRQPVLDRFLIEVARRLPHHSFLVAGPQYPAGLQWPENVRRLEHLPQSEHAQFYSSSKWQLNATRSDMVVAGWSPSVRLFEAGACAAAIISDSWPGIDVLFDAGREILLPDSTETVVEILTSTSAEERREIGDALRMKILAEHTADRRAAELESIVFAPAPATGG